jgi:hypothetical protein
MKIELHKPYLGLSFQKSRNHNNIQLNQNSKLIKSRIKMELDKIIEQQTKIIDLIENFLLCFNLSVSLFMSLLLLHYVFLLRQMLLTRARRVPLLPERVSNTIHFTDNKAKKDNESINFSLSATSVGRNECTLRSDHKTDFEIRDMKFGSLTSRTVNEKSRRPQIASCNENKRRRYSADNPNCERQVVKTNRSIDLCKLETEANLNCTVIDFV